MPRSLLIIGTIIIIIITIIIIIIIIVVVVVVFVVIIIIIIIIIIIVKWGLLPTPVMTPLCRDPIWGGLSFGASKSRFVFWWIL